jgi:hypothetical protein
MGWPCGTMGQRCGQCECCRRRVAEDAHALRVACRSAPLLFAVAFALAALQEAP